ncbi:MAG TPA: ATP-binding protein, partial [Anaerolineae bacterium]|nr:ATP-binding protein [Anaerolineae bacterium]
MRLFSSLRSRLVFSHLTVIVLAMGLSGLLLLTFLQDYFVRSTEDSLIAQARLTVQALVPDANAVGPSITTQAPLNNALQQSASNLVVQATQQTSPSLNTADLNYLANTSLQLSAQIDTRIRLLNADGVVLVDTAKTDTGLNLHDDPLVRRALQGQYASSSDLTSDQARVVVTMPVLVDGKTIGAAYLSESLRDVLTVLQDLRVRLVLATAIALILSGTMSWWLSRAITRPVRQLTAAADAVAVGRFDQWVSVQSHDELGRLGRTFNDMTTRLQSARKMQIDFVADVSHELRTPLTSIKGTIETLRSGAVDDLGVRDQFLETVEAETDRLIRLVSDLLVLSRADSAALNLRRESIDLGQLIRAVTNRLADQAAMHQIKLQVSIDPDMPLVSADADRIEQVLLNLLDNALKYSPLDRTVTIHLAAETNRSVMVQVRDEGRGISAADLDRIGQRFYRADKSRARGGHGLGLAIAQSLIQAHGGRLWLESKEGAGTT